MLFGFLILLLFQLLGEFVVRTLNLVVPGPVLGMVFLFIALFIYPDLKSKVAELSRFINAYLALFFVPAGGGLIEYFDLFGRFGAAIVITIVASTVITLAVTAVCFSLLLGKKRAE